MRSATYMSWDRVKTRRGRARRSNSTSARMSLPCASRTLEMVPRSMLRAPEMIEAMIPQAIALDPTLDEAQITVAMTQVWEQLFPAEQQRLVRLLVERVIVTPTNLELRLRPGGIGSLAADARQAFEAVA